MTSFYVLIFAERRSEDLFCDYLCIRHLHHGNLHASEYDMNENLNFSTKTIVLYIGRGVRYVIVRTVNKFTFTAI